MNNEKETFLKTWEQEYATTLKILKAYPQDKQDLKPAHICKNARELSWVFPNEERVMMGGAACGGIDFSQFQPAPATMKEALDFYEKNHATVVESVKKMTDEQWHAMLPFMVAPKQMGKVRAADLLWMTLHDCIHHRGQFSIYLRMADAKVPSIYGPTADEPWM